MKKKILAVLLVGILAVASAGGWYVDQLLDRVDYETDETVPAAEPDTLWQDDVLNILLLGTDERSEE